MLYCGYDRKGQRKWQQVWQIIKWILPFGRSEKEAADAVIELLTQAKLEEGDILVVGCSSSEVVGERIGTFSSVETAEAVFDGIYEVTKQKGIYLAAQCCEHLNRALIVEKN